MLMAKITKVQGQQHLSMWEGDDDDETILMMTIVHMIVDDDGAGDDVDGQDNKSTGPAALERVGGKNVRRHLSRDSGWIILKGEAGI